MLDSASFFAISPWYSSQKCKPAMTFFKILTMRIILISFVYHRFPKVAELQVLCWITWVEEISLVVQCLRLVLPMQGIWVWSLIRELRFHMQCSVAGKKKKSRWRFCATWTSFDTHESHFPSSVLSKPHGLSLHGIWKVLGTKSLFFFTSWWWHGSFGLGSNATT